MKKLYLIFAVLLIVSCEKDDSIDREDVDATSEVSLLNDRIIFDSKKDLKHFLETHKDIDLDEKVGKMYSKGFKPLTPFGMKKGSEEYANFIAKKKIRIEKNKSYALKDYNIEEDFDADDEIIADPDFAALLDENRSIYVGDELYVYTEDGVYFCKIEEEKKLWKYLEEKQKEDKGQKQLQKIELIEEPCDTYLKSVESDEGISLEPPTGQVYTITPEISLFLTCGGGGGGSGGGDYNPTPIPAKIPLAAKANLKFCAVYKKSLWQKAFGAVEECNSYFDNDHRVKGRFWNVNYHLWASTGVLVKHQSKAWIGWTQSDGVDYTELGVNSLVYNVKTSMAKYFKDSFIGNYLRYKGLTYLVRGYILVPVPDFPALPNWAYNTRDPYNYDVELFLFTKEVKDLEGDALKNYVIELVNNLQSASPLSYNLISDNASVMALIPPVNDSHFRTVIYNRNQKTTGGKIKTDLAFSAFQFKSIGYSNDKVQDLIDSGVFNANEGADASGTGSSEKTFIQSLKDLSKGLPDLEIRTTEEQVLKSVDIYGVCRKGGKIYRGLQFGLRED
jgi:hypothetical protein